MGSNKAQKYGKTKNDCLFVCLFCFLLQLWGGGFNYSRMAMIPDRLQSFLEPFWNDQKCDQTWTLGPRIYHQNFPKT